MQQHESDGLGEEKREGGTVVNHLFRTFHRCITDSIVIGYEWDILASKHGARFDSLRYTLLYKLYYYVGSGTVHGRSR